MIQSLSGQLVSTPANARALAAAAAVAFPRAARAMNAVTRPPPRGVGHAAAAFRCLSGYFSRLSGSFSRALSVVVVVTISRCRYVSFSVGLAFCAFLVYAFIRVCDDITVICGMYHSLAAEDNSESWLSMLSGT